MEPILYIGTYTTGESKGIYSARLREDGTLGPVRLEAEADNPSYLAPGADGRSLYAVLETDTFAGQPGGGVVSYAVEADGRLTRTGAQSTLGAFPCYISVDPAGEFLFVANYGSADFLPTGASDATLVSFPIENGAVGAPLQKTSHAGHGAHPERQRCPHAHFLDFTPDGRLCAVDLGIDLIFSYTVAPSGALYEIWQTRCFPGCGPRHMAFLPQAQAAYVVNELTSDITLLRVRPQGGYMPEDYYATLPAGFKGENLPAAIKISPDGRLLVVSNRGHDSIAVYRIKEFGELDEPNFVPCGGKGPRDLVFSPDGRFLYAANEKSDSITAFAVQNGALLPLGEVAHVGSPVCLKSLPV